jgi:hypothetical protein
MLDCNLRPVGITEAYAPEGFVVSLPAVAAIGHYGVVGLLYGFFIYEQNTLNPKSIFQNLFGSSHFV